MLFSRVRRAARTLCLLLALCLTVEAGALPALAVPASGGAPEADSFVADTMRREFARIGAKTEAFLKELEELGASGIDPDLEKLLADPSVTALSTDVTAEFTRFLRKEYPEVWEKFFQKTPDMLGIEVDIVFQILRSDDLKDAEGLRDKLRHATLLFKGEPARMRALMLDDQFRSLVKLSGEPVLHNLAKDTLVGAFVGCGIDAGLNLLLGNPFDPKEFAGKVALDFVRSYLADVTKRTVTKALLTRVATGNKVLYTAVGRFGMVSGTFVGAIVGMIGGELLDWILKGDASGLKRLADHPEVLLERGAMCVAGQLLGEAFSWAFAAVGSAFGPVGTVVGKALGFVVGYAIGYCVVGKILESRRDRSARDFVSKGRYFKARADRAARILEAAGNADFQTFRTLQDLADGAYADLVKEIGGHPADAAVVVAAEGDSADAKKFRAKLADAARELHLDGAALGLLVKQQVEIDETASFLRAFESSYEETLDRDMKRFNDETWAQATNAGPVMDGALDRFKGTIWYEKIKSSMEGTDLIDPELNIWSYDRHSDRIVKLGPAFVGDVKETVFVTGKPSDRGAFDRLIDTWFGGSGGEEREPRLRDFLSKYYVRTDDDHFPWHYNPLVDDWAPKYALPTAAAGGVLSLDPDATVGEYGGATEEGLALLAEVKRIDDAARAEQIDLSRDVEAMSATLLHAGDRLDALPESLRQVREAMRFAEFGSTTSLVFRNALGDGDAWRRMGENLIRIRNVNAYLFKALHELVRPDEATLALFASPFGWEVAMNDPERAARILSSNLDRLAAFCDLVRALGAKTMHSAKDLLVALDATPSAGFFKRGLDRSLQREFDRLAAGGFFGGLFDAAGRIAATVGGNAGGRPVKTRDVKPEKLGRYLMMATLRTSVCDTPFKPTADTEKKRAFLPAFEAALAKAQESLKGEAAEETGATGVRELDRRLRTNTVK